MTTRASVMIGTPHNGAYWADGYVRCLMHTCNDIPGIGWDVASTSWLPSSRDLLIDRFMTDEHARSFTHLMMIDSDQVWDPTDILRLLSHDVPIVSGIYCYKHDNTKGVFGHHPPPLRRHPDNHDLIRVKFVGGGFLLMKRSLVKAMWEKAPTYKMPGKDHKIKSLFYVPDLSKEGFIGEDAAFCMRVQKIAREDIWLDQRCIIGHIADGIPVFPIVEYDDREGKKVEDLNGK